MIFSFIWNRKTITIRLVTYRLWLEASTWLTKRSSKKGWQFTLRRGGPLIITPWVGMALAVNVDSRRVQRGQTIPTDSTSGGS